MPGHSGAGGLLRSAVPVVAGGLVHHLLRSAVAGRGRRLLGGAVSADVDRTLRLGVPSGPLPARPPAAGGARRSADVAAGVGRRSDAALLQSPYQAVRRLRPRWRRFPLVVGGTRRTDVEPGVDRLPLGLRGYRFFSYFFLSCRCISYPVNVLVFLSKWERTFT